MSLCNPMDCSTSGIPVLHCFPEFTQTHDNWVMPSNHLILCHPSSPALNFPQHQGLLQCVGSSHQVEYWSFSFSISPSSEYSGSAAFWIKSFSLPQHRLSDSFIGLSCGEQSKLGLGNKRTSPRIPLLPILAAKPQNDTRSCGSH